jgi:hypothetical protein
VIKNVNVIVKMILAASKKHVLAAQQSAVAIETDA